LIPPKNITAAVYTSITFSCTGKGFGGVKVVWTKPLSKVTSTAVYTSRKNDDHITSTLTISRLVDIYSGKYCCAVENDAGTSELGCAYLHIEGLLVLNMHVCTQLYMYVHIVHCYMYMFYLCYLSYVCIYI